MPKTAQRNRRASPTSRQPFRVHIENEARVMPVFTVYPAQYEAALKRHPDVARTIETTWGVDGDVFDRAIQGADALIGYYFPRERLAERAPHLKFVQVLGAGVDYRSPKGFKSSRSPERPGIGELHSAPCQYFARVASATP